MMRTSNSQIAPMPLPEEFETDLTGLKIALSPDLGFYAVHPEVASNFRSCAAALSDAGAVIEEVELPWTSEIVDTWLQWWGVYQAAAFAHFLPEYRDKMDPSVVTLIENGLVTDAVTFKRIETIRTQQWHSLASVFANFDALICPTMALPAADAEMNDDGFGGFDANGKLIEFDMTGPFNMVAQCPALSVPSGATETGLPTGIQIVARRFDDPTALRIGAAIEKHRPWKIWQPVDA